MDIKQFAETHRLKGRRDSCDEPIIPGKPRQLKRAEDRLHIYDNGDGRFGLCYVQVGSKASVGKYHNVQKKLLAAGFIQGQKGDAEGTFLFNPADTQQAKLAIKVAGCRQRRVLSPEEYQELQGRGLRLALIRSNPKENTHLGV